jgi:hypothetical protein
MPAMHEETLSKVKKAVLKLKQSPIHRLLRE